MYLFVVLFAFEKCVTSQTINDLDTLISDLFHNYTSEYRPVFNLSDSVEVKVGFYLSRLDNFDSVSGMLTLWGMFSLSWKDYRLQWKPSDYNGVHNFTVPISKVWYPELLLLSSADEMEYITNGHKVARILFDGTIFITPGKRLRTTCDVDMTRFPKIPRHVVW